MYRSPNTVRVVKSRRLRWADYVARMEEGRCTFNILTGKTPKKRLPGRPRCKWENGRILEKLLSGIGLVRLRIEIIGEPL